MISEPQQQGDGSSYAEFEELFSRLPDAMLIADDDGRYVFANDAARALLGLTDEDISTFTLADFSSQPDGAAAAWAQFLRDGHQEGEFVLRRCDGSLVPTEFKAVARFAPGRHLSILRDMSGRQRIENLLRHNEERFVKAFISSPAPTNIRLLDTGTFLEANDAFSNELGFWRSDILGRTAVSLGLWTDEEQLLGLLSELKQGQDEVRTRATLRRKDRSELEFSVAMRRVEMHGEPHVIAVYWDISRN